MHADRFDGLTRLLAMRRFTQRSFALLIVSLVLLGTLATPALAKPGQTSCQYEYNATSGNFLVYKYKGDTLTYTYATDRPPRNCDPVDPAPPPPPPPPTRVVILTWEYDPGLPGFCGAIVTVAGFADGTYEVTGIGSWLPMITVSGGSGYLSSSDTSTSFIAGPTYVFTATVDGVSSNLSTVAC